MDVFSAFSHAIVSGVWEIGSVIKATERGDIYKKISGLDVIVEEETDITVNRSPNADYIQAGTLVYVKPSQLPTLTPAAISGKYLLKNTETNQIYSIKSTDIGKNQETGQIEHVELWIEPQEAIEDGDSD